jgi:pheromone shutdown protein TraB
VKNRDKETFIIIHRNNKISEAFTIDDTHNFITSFTNIVPQKIGIDLCPTLLFLVRHQESWHNKDIFRVFVDGQLLLLIAEISLMAHCRKLKVDFDWTTSYQNLLSWAEQNSFEILALDKDINSSLKAIWSELSIFKKTNMILSVWKYLRTDKIRPSNKGILNSISVNNLIYSSCHDDPLLERFLIRMPDQTLSHNLSCIDHNQTVSIINSTRHERIKSIHRSDAEIKNFSDTYFHKKSIWPIVIPSLIIVAIYIGIQKRPSGTTMQLLIGWILPNSFFAGLCTLIARAKWMTIMVSAIASPITSLAPGLSTGMIAGLVEAWLIKPTVKDAKELSNSLSSLYLIRSNPFGKIMFVALMAMIGSGIGEWIGFTYVFKKLI